MRRSGGWVNAATRPFPMDCLIGPHAYSGANSQAHSREDETMGEQKHEHGTMDVTAQEKTFAGFMSWTVWTCVVIAIVLIFLAVTQT